MLAHDLFLVFHTRTFCALLKLVIVVNSTWPIEKGVTDKHGEIEKWDDLTAYLIA